MLTDEQANYNKGTLNSTMKALCGKCASVKRHSLRIDAANLVKISRHFKEHLRRLLKFIVSQ